MNRASFACMLDHHAAERGHNFEWMLKRYHRLFGSRAKWPAETEPVPPTVAFVLVLRSIEADIACQPRAIPRGGVDPWASKLQAW